MEIKGKIILIGEIQTIGDKGFTKREFVIETNENYPQKVKFELNKDACSKVDQFKVGNGVEVSFNLRGNEYQGKYYVNLQAWKVIKIGEGAPVVQPESDPIGNEDDLPF
jgi:single-strand DNA-binding protein